MLHSVQAAVQYILHCCCNVSRNGTQRPPAAGCCCVFHNHLEVLLCEFYLQRISCQQPQCLHVRAWGTLQRRADICRHVLLDSFVVFVQAVHSSVTHSSCAARCLRSAARLNSSVLAVHRSRISRYDAYYISALQHLFSWEGFPLAFPDFPEGRHSWLAEILEGYPAVVDFLLEGCPKVIVVALLALTCACLPHGLLCP